MTALIPLLIVLGTVLGAVFQARRAVKLRTMEDWALGGRKLGALLFWFLNAGEIYTTFAVLGVIGFAWAHGAPAYIAFTSVSLSAVIGYWLTPNIWRAGKTGNLITQSDFFAWRYNARWLGVIVAIAGIVALIVYVQIQITALSLVLRLTMGPALSPLSSALLAALFMIMFVYAAGLRSAAFAAAIKDILMVVLIVGLSMTAASHAGATSLMDIFRQVEKSRPDLVRFQPGTPLGMSWFVTSALNVALGTWVFPHMFQLSFSSQDEDALRRNAIYQPLYSLSYFFIILLAFAAVLARTSPSGGDPNAVLLHFVEAKYPSWVLGALVGTVSLLALVPGSVLLLTSGSIFSRNIVRPLFSTLSDRVALIISRLSMIAFGLAAVWLTVAANRSLVEIGLSAYAAVGMLAPGVFLGFLWNRVGAIAVLAGLIVGYAILFVPTLALQVSTSLPGWEPGLVAMAANALTIIVVTRCTLPRATLNLDTIKRPVIGNE